MKNLSLLFAVLLAVCCADKQSVNLEEGFLDPPHSARPQLWWHWMNGNVTEDGVRRDIEWFSRAGIGGFCVFDTSFDNQMVVDERLVYMQGDWNKAFALAVGLADSLGMDVAVPGSPGFSSTGGPWVKPYDAMKKVVWREMLLDGGRRFTGALPKPYTSTGKFQNYGEKAQGMYSS